MNYYYNGDMERGINMRKIFFWLMAIIIVPTIVSVIVAVLSGGSISDRMESIIGTAVLCVFVALLLSIIVLMRKFFKSISHRETSANTLSPDHPEHPDHLQWANREGTYKD